MRIKSVRMKNIRSYIDENINFPQGSILLSGNVGSGKTTILLAIDFALFGTRRGELNSSELLRNGSNEGYVKLVIELDRREIVITRTLKRKKSISQEAGSIEIDGVCTDYTSTEISAKISEMIGYPEKNNSLVYRYSVYTPQEEMKSILIDKEKRIQIMRKIFGIDKYGIIKENVKIILSDLRSEKRIYDEHSKDIMEKTDELRTEENKKNYIIMQLKEKESFIEDVDNKINEIKDKINIIKKNIEKTNEININISKKTSELSQKKIILKKLESELVLHRSKILELQKRKDIYKNYVKPEPVKENINLLEKEKDSLFKNISILEKEIWNLKGTLSKGMCSHCGQNIHNALSFEMNLKTKEDEFKKNNIEIGEIKNNILKIKNQIDENNRYNLVEEKQNSIRREIENEIEYENKKTQERESIIIEIENIDNFISNLNRQIDSNIQNNYEIMEKDLQKLISKKIDLEKEKSSTNQQIENKDEIILRLKKEIQKKKEMKEKSVKISEYINWMGDQFSSLMSNIEKHVMILIQKEFDRMFKEYFSLFINDINVRLDESFTPVIDQNSYETDYENLSGGEKTSVALSYRLALNSVINSIIENIKTKDIIILDEPTDGFSSEQLDKLRDVLLVLKLSQIIIVSHEQKIDAFVENVIRVEKDNHVSRIF